jgi:hypothetical protein
MGLTFTRALTKFEKTGTSHLLHFSAATVKNILQKYYYDGFVRRCAK